VAFATPTPQTPIIAIQPSDTTGWTTMMGYTKSGSNWTGFTVGSGAGSSFNWKAYVAHPTTKAENYGLIINDASGNIVFDSARTYFKIYSVTTGIALANTSAYQDITHAGISNPYYLWAPERFAWVNMPNYLFFRTCIRKIDATSVRISWQVLGGASGSPPGSSGIDSLTQSLIVLK
jgi:hypothetical protein